MVSADGRAAGYSGPEGTASQRSTHSEQHGGWVPQHCNRHSMCSNWSRAAEPLTSNSMVEVGSALVTRTTLTALPGMAITCAIRADSPEGRRGTELDLHHTTRDLKKKVQVHHLQLKIHREIKCRDTAPFFVLTDVSGVPDSVLTCPSWPTKTSASPNGSHSRLPALPA